MANKKGHPTGQVHKNVPGVLYVVKEVYDKKFSNNDSEWVPVKIGLAYGDYRAGVLREKEHKTGSSAKKVTLCSFCVDEDTEIPTPEGTRGGVYEMEQYLHHVMGTYGWENVGAGTEWFAIPRVVADMCSDIEAAKTGAEIKFNWAKCPELARAIAYAPSEQDVPAFDDGRTIKNTRGKKINTTRTATGRSSMEERIDKDMPRKHKRDYMLRRGAVSGVNKP